MPIVMVASFALGAASGAFVKSLHTRRKLRPYARSGLRKGVSLGRAVRRRVAGLVEDFEDLLAEAMMEDDKAPETTVPVGSARAHGEPHRAASHSKLS